MRAWSMVGMVVAACGAGEGPVSGTSSDTGSTGRTAGTASDAETTEPASASSATGPATEATEDSSSGEATRGSGSASTGDPDCEPRVDFAMSITDAADPLSLGRSDWLVYTVGLENRGPDDPSASPFFDFFYPAQLQWIGAAPNMGGCIPAEAGRVLCTGPVPSGETMVVDITFVVDAPGVVDVSAAVITIDCDPVSDNDTATESTTVVE